MVTGGLHYGINMHYVLKVYCVQYSYWPSRVIVEVRIRDAGIFREWHLSSLLLNLVVFSDYQLLI